MVALGIMAILLLALTFDFLAERLPGLKSASGRPGAERTGRFPTWLPAAVPADYCLSPCHVWMHSEGHGLVRLGSDGFASAFLGRPDAIEVVVHAGAVVRGQPLAVLSRKGRRITLRSPLAGTLVERHDGLDAEQATADPFGHGWLATIRPDGDLLGGAARVAEQARAWMSSEWERVRALVANELRSPGAVGATLADGGSLQPGFLLHLDERQHVALERSCFDVAARATGFEVTDALASVGARLAQGSRS